MQLSNTFFSRTQSAGNSPSATFVVICTVLFANFVVASFRIHATSQSIIKFSLLFGYGRCYRRRNTRREKIAEKNECKVRHSHAIDFELSTNSSSLLKLLHCELLEQTQSADRLLFGFGRVSAIDTSKLTLFFFSRVFLMNKISSLSLFVRSCRFVFCAENKRQNKNRRKHKSQQ